MSNITLVGAQPPDDWGGRSRLERRLERQLQAMENHTLRRIASVQAEGMVTVSKLREVEHAAQQAMVNQSLLTRTRETLAAGDPLLQDELRVYTDINKFAQVEILTDLADQLRYR